MTLFREITFLAGARFSEASRLDFQAIFCAPPSPAFFLDESRKR